MILGRRGPAQAAFTNPELLELGELADADVIVDEAELERALAVADPDAEADITCRRNVEILRDYASRPAKGHRKRIVLRFLLSPAAFLADDHGRLGTVELVRNELVPAPSGGLRAAATVERETLAAGLAFRAIGYRGIPLPACLSTSVRRRSPTTAAVSSTPTHTRAFPASTSSAGSSAALPA